MTSRGDSRRRSGTEVLRPTRLSDFPLALLDLGGDMGSEPPVVISHTEPPRQPVGGERSAQLFHADAGSHMSGISSS